MTSTDRDTVDETSSVSAFVAKWRAREPEMAFAEVFCPRPLRRRFELWGALLFEWREAAFELSDTRPTEAKCVWWADEALRCAQSAPRHPLTLALAAPKLPWSALARGLTVMSDTDLSRPGDREEALLSVTPLADGMAAVECALFDVPLFDQVGRANAVRAIAAHLLCERLRNGLAAADGGRVPLSLLARHAIAAKDLAGPRGEPAARDWAGELAATLAANESCAAAYRRVRAAFDLWYLREFAKGQHRHMPPWRALLLAWRSAREGRR